MANVSESRNNQIYAEIITSLATTAAAKVEGITVLGNDNSGKKKKLHGSVVQVYFIKDKVSIDIFINVYYGYRVPDVVCTVQERIKQDVEAATRYKVGSINVKVVSVIFPKL